MRAPVGRCQKTAEWRRGRGFKARNNAPDHRPRQAIVECGGASPRRERPLTEVLGDSSCEHLVCPVHDGVE